MRTGAESGGSCMNGHPSLSLKVEIEPSWSLCQEKDKSKRVGAESSAGQGPDGGCSLTLAQPACLPARCFRREPREHLV